MQFQTKAVLNDGSFSSKHGETVPAIYQSAAFSYDDADAIQDVFDGKRFGHVYSRISNPSVSAFEQRVNSLENGRSAIAFSSGMAALHAVFLALASPGDTIVASSSLFGGTYTLFQQVLIPLGISIKYVDPTDINDIEAAISSSTAAIFVESLGNPKLDVPNLSLISECAKKHAIPFILDNTLTTPYLCDAKALGVDITVNASTKYLGSSGASVGGYICDCGNFDWSKIRKEPIQQLSKRAGEFAFIAYLKQSIVTNLGSLMNPFNAFMFTIGLETLSLRMEQHCRNAHALADFLNTGSECDVCYPWLIKSSSI